MENNEGTDSGPENEENTKAVEVKAETKEVPVNEEVQEKEFEEAFDALDEIAEFAGKVAADGEVNAKDLPHLVILATKLDKIMKGFEGVNKALPPAITKRFSSLALLRVWGVFDAFKKGKESI